MDCNPSAGPVTFCTSCDEQLHTNAHLHRRQQYDGCWQDLPLVGVNGKVAVDLCAAIATVPDPTYCFCAGWFTFKPSRCTTAGCDGDFADLPEKDQDLDFITRGETSSCCPNLH